MINETIYRLGEYRIIEYENGLLRWETYYHFGVQRSGKCFILGDILIIGHWSHEEPGYLILEFFEQLQKLPVWNKTRYYCFAFELLDVATGQSLTNDFLERYLTFTSSTGSKSLMNMSPGMFRLGRYQIVVTDQGEVLWQTYEGLHKVVGGQCVIESDILFIGPQEYDEGNQSKREFLNKLKQLPKWDKSMAWCRNLVLRKCQYKQQTENPSFATNHQDTMDEHSFDEKPSTFYLNQYKEPPKRLLRLGFKWLETTLHRIRAGKGWLKYIIPLFVVGLLLGLVIILHSVEKKSHLPHWDKQHHHEHDDD
ncbi:MAG: hypothetical protein ABIB41_08565 [Nitrospirota bacterium]